MSEKFVLVSLEEEKAKKLAEAISNSTARKILNYLSEIEEAPESKIAKDLKIPLNTAHYNLQNLKKSGLVEVEEFKWSEKGRKIDLYKIAKKFILISPKGTTIDKSKLKNLFSIALISGFGSVLAGYIAKSFLIAKQTLSAPMIAAKSEIALEAAPKIAAQTQQYSQLGFYITLFLIGALFAFIIYSLFNWKRR